MGTLPTIMCHPGRRSTLEDVQPPGAALLAGDVKGAVTLEMACGSFRCHGEPRGATIQPAVPRPCVLGDCTPTEAHRESMAPSPQLEDGASEALLSLQRRLGTSSVQRRSPTAARWASRCRRSTDGLRVTSHCAAR